MPSLPSRVLETFPNPEPSRDYWVHIEVPEFTCLCPLTGQPDFAHFTLDYIPDHKNLELKALKLYMWSFRSEGAFHEAVTNQITNDMVEAAQPRYLRLTARWYVRGGIFTTVVTEHRKAGWAAPPPVSVPAFAQQPSTVHPSAAPPSTSN